LLVCEALDSVIVLSIVVRRAPPPRVIFMLLAETFRSSEELNEGCPSGASRVQLFMILRAELIRRQLR
jgi:hypothetical protein